MNTTVSAAPRMLREPSSPFVAARPKEEPLDPLLPEGGGRGLFELLREPQAIALKLTEPDARQEVVLTSLSAVALGMAVFAGTLMAKDGLLIASRAALLLAFNTLLGLAASIGPIYATSILVAARLPLGRLVGVLLAAAGAGSLLLAATTPVNHLLFRIDPLWLGPLGTTASFLLVGLGTGLRTHKLLHALALAVRARGPDGASPLSEGEKFRLGILARMAFVIGTLTASLAVWAFDPFQSW